MASTLIDPWHLLEIAESANPPETQPSNSPNWCGEVLFYAKESWCVVFFYDCGELDYIDHFVRPDGAILDVWPDGGVDQSEWQGIVGSWRSCGDLARMKSWIAKPLSTGE